MGCCNDVDIFTNLPIFDGDGVVCLVGTACGGGIHSNPLATFRTMSYNPCDSLITPYFGRYSEDGGWFSCTDKIDPDTVNTSVAFFRTSTFGKIMELYKMGKAKNDSIIESLKSDKKIGGLVKDKTIINMTNTYCRQAAYHGLHRAWEERRPKDLSPSAFAMVESEINIGSTLDALMSADVEKYAKEYMEVVFPCLWAAIVLHKSFLLSVENAVRQTEDMDLIFEMAGFTLAEANTIKKQRKS